MTSFFIQNNYYGTHTHKYMLAPAEMSKRIINVEAIRKHVKEFR